MMRLLIVLWLLAVGGCAIYGGAGSIPWLDGRRPGSDALWQAAAAGWLVAVLAGVVAGWRKGITVFRNYDDLALVFFAGASLLGAFYVIVMSTGDGWVRPAVLGLLLLTAGVCSIVIAIRTWIDNRNPLWFAVALVTKVSLGAIFLIHLASLIVPEGKTNAQRAKRRASALGWLVLITPVIVRLVRDHEGIWTPRTVLNQYQRGRLRL
ncbi:MAG: hypothetical protein KF891_01320 [Rhizobacter sp.]|nr:hypothetical protein [Rhizobacter sp.]